MKEAAQRHPPQGKLFNLGLPDRTPLPFLRWNCPGLRGTIAAGYALQVLAGLAVFLMQPVAARQEQHSHSIPKGINKLHQQASPRNRHNKPAISDRSAVIPHEIMPEAGQHCCWKCQYCEHKTEGYTNDLHESKSLGPCQGPHGGNRRSCKLSTVQNPPQVDERLTEGTDRHNAGCHIERPSRQSLPQVQQAIHL